MCWMRRQYKTWICCLVLRWVIIGFIAYPYPIFANEPAIIHPSGGQVVEGQASIAINPSNPHHQIITQTTPQAIIDWNRFSIGANEITEFKQPGSDSVVLNRVTGGFPSDIWGTLKSNGHVFLINPAGITVWKGGKIDVASWVASTAHISNKDFLAGIVSGNYHFRQAPGDAFAVVNHGEITIKEGGLAALVGPGAANYGVIKARLSRVILAEGTEYTLVDTYGDGLIQFAINQPSITAQIKTSDGKAFKHAVANTGKIEAEGGKVVLMTTGAVKNVLDEVINTSGVIRANSIKKENGTVYIFDAGSSTRGVNDKGIVKITGKIEAKGNEPGEYGGNVIITGKRVQGGHHLKPILERDILAEERYSIDVSGMAGPGSILFGGDAHKVDVPLVDAHHQNLPEPTPATRGNKIYWPEFFRDENKNLHQNQNRNHEVPASEATVLGHDVALIADNLDVGSGGKIIVTSAMTRKAGSANLQCGISKGLTRIYGSQSAKGGPKGGHGGYIQNCGDWIDAAGKVEATRLGSPFGNKGLYYIDPFNVTIVTPQMHGAFAFNVGTNTETWTPSGSPSQVQANNIVGFLNAGHNVTIQTNGGGGGESGNILVNSITEPDLPNNATLTLSAAGSIQINANIGVTGAGTVNLVLLAPNGSITGNGVLNPTELTLQAGISVVLGNPPGPPPKSSVNGNTSGSNITLLGSQPSGTATFNGNALVWPGSSSSTPSTNTVNTVVSTLNPSNTKQIAETATPPGPTSPKQTPTINDQPPSKTNPVEEPQPTPPSPPPSPAEPPASPPAPPPTPAATAAESTTPTTPPAAPPSEAPSGPSTGPVQNAPPTDDMIGGGVEGREPPTNAEAAGGREGVAEGAFNNPDAIEKTELVTRSGECNENNPSKQCIENPLGVPMSQEAISKALGENKNAPITPDGVNGVDPDAIGGGAIDQEKITNADAALGDESVFARSQRGWSIENIDRTPEYLENLGPDLSKKKKKVSQNIQKLP